MDSLEAARGLSAEVAKRRLVGLPPPALLSRLQLPSTPVAPPPFKSIVSSTLGYFCLRRWALNSQHAGLLPPLLFLLEAIHDLSSATDLHQALRVAAACETVAMLWSRAHSLWPRNADLLASVGFDERAVDAARTRLTVASAAVRAAIADIAPGTSVTEASRTAFAPMALALGQVLHRAFHAFSTQRQEGAWHTCAALFAVAAASAAAPLSHRAFEIKGRLGTGAYSVVYAAVKRDSGRLYAMKCVDKRRIFEQGGAQMLLHEREVLGIVRACPFVSSLRYAFHSSKEVCFVTEIFCTDLENCLRHRIQLSTNAARLLLAEVFLGLRYLHERGIMHRDIKPANVLVDAAGHACLSDLGLSTFVSNPAMRASLLEKMRTASDAASGPTNHSMPDLRRCAVEVNGHVVRPYIRGRAGTPGYWAPEILAPNGADGKAPAYDGSADLWSFGCLAYALLAGQGPFCVTGGGTDDDNAATLSGDPPYTPASAFPPDARDFCKRLLIADPALRLGCGPTGLHEIANHPFFAQHIDWTVLNQRLGCEPGRWRPPPGLCRIDVSERMLRDHEEAQARLAGVVLPAEEQAKYEDVPFSAPGIVELELVQAVLLVDHHAAVAASVESSQTSTRRVDRPVAPLQNASAIIDAWKGGLTSLELFLHIELGSGAVVGRTSGSASTAVSAATMQSALTANAELAAPMHGADRSTSQRVSGTRGASMTGSIVSDMDSERSGCG